ncbi:hypothetical protein GOBAR_DD04215 [Gossypium barbadense]|nr:hypothetical protein GOBAR_DD04215 [Gossypium barbadense]
MVKSIYQSDFPKLLGGSKRLEEGKQGHLRKLIFTPPFEKSIPSGINFRVKMIDDEQLGFLANFLGIFIFALVIAYHYVMADPKYEGN